MKEAETSCNLRKLNKDYLDLLYSPAVRKAMRNKGGLRKRILLIISFVKQGRAKEMIVRLRGRKKNMPVKCNRDIGVPICEDNSKEYFENKKVVVYTALFGNKIPICEPLYCNPDYDYYIFTDQSVPKKSHWKKMQYNEKDFPDSLDGAGKNRWFKLHPHLYFQDYDCSVYVDGGIIIVGDVMPWVSEMKGRLIGTHILSLPVDCVYESSKTVIGAQKAPKDLVIHQMQKYKSEGYPRHNGMYENGVLVRFHMERECIGLMDDWWEEMCAFTMRDQLSLGYVLWKNHILKEKILLLGDNIFKNDRIRFWDL